MRRASILLTSSSLLRSVPTVPSPNSRRLFSSHSFSPKRTPVNYRFFSSSVSLAVKSTSKLASAIVVGGSLIYFLMVKVGIRATPISGSQHSYTNDLYTESRQPSEQLLIPHDTEVQVFKFRNDTEEAVLVTELDPLQIKVGTSLSQNPIDTLISKINSGRVCVQAVVYKFDNDQIYTALSEALGRGVRVQLICDSHENKKPRSKAYKLRAEGASVEFWDNTRLKKLHAKFTIVDSEYVLSGSSNWTRNANSDNMELVLQFHGNVKEFSYTFESMWDMLGSGIGS